MRAAQQPSPCEPLATRDRLLAATEALVLRVGAATVSTRAIGAEAGVNWALVSYHFGGMDGLLAELLMLNIERIAAVRAQQLTAAATLRGRAARFDAILAAYTDPMWSTSAAWTPASANAVVRVLLQAVAPAGRMAAARRINASIETVVAALSPLLPDMPRDVMIIRLRLLSGAAEMLLPRVDQLGLYALQNSDAVWRRAELQSQLHRIARAALQA